MQCFRFHIIKKANTIICIALPTWPGKTDWILTYLQLLTALKGLKNISPVADNAILNAVKKDFEAINETTLTGLQKIMNLDFDNILAGNLLVKMDIATMAHSLEGRSPLLSKEI